ncbi:MAG: multiple sugar transport system permease protein [Micromonosporaceae bacterium]
MSAGSARRRMRHQLTGYAFVLPFMVVFVAMLVVPLGYALYLSLFRHQLIGGTVFAGLGNYRAALSDHLLWAGVARTATLLVIQVPVMIGLALGSALALDSGRLALARLVRLGIFLPFAVPGVVAALMWGYLYGPDFGPFAQLAAKVGLGRPGFLTGSWMLGSLGNVVTWEFTGYNMIILFAAMQAIPTELYEAARMDGAGPVRVAWRIKLPLIRPALLLTVLFSIIGTFQLFNEPNIMSRLAPTVIGTSYTPNLYAYNLAFTNQEINYSAAVSFALGFVILVVSYAAMFLANRRRPAR